MLPAMRCAFTAIFVAWCIENARQVACEWLIWNPQRKPGGECCNKKPAPTILRLCPLFMRIKDCLGHVVAEMLQMLNERLACQRGRKRGHVFKDIG